MRNYAKFLVAFFGGIGAWGVTAAADSTYTQVELWGLGAVLATAVGVFVVENK